MAYIILNDKKFDVMKSVTCPYFQRYTEYSRFGKCTNTDRKYNGCPRPDGNIPINENLLFAPDLCPLERALVKGGMYDEWHRPSILPSFNLSDEEKQKMKEMTEKESTEKMKLTEAEDKPNLVLDRELSKIILGHGCPMTKQLCERYRLTDEEVKKFCKCGCSPDCAKDFARMFADRKVKQ